MNVKVIDRLSAIGAGVDDGSEAVRQTKLFSHLAGNDEEMSQQGGITIRRVRQRPNPSLRDDQNVRGSLGVQVTKSECQFVFVDNVRRDLSINDLLKNRHPTERPEARARGNREVTPSRSGVVQGAGSDGITALPVAATNHLASAARWDSGQGCSTTFGKSESRRLSKIFPILLIAF